jgi:uncharacterized protein YkwD
MRGAGGYPARAISARLVPLKGESMRSFALVVLAGLLLAACSSGSSESRESPTASAAAGATQATEVSSPKPTDIWTPTGVLMRTPGPETENPTDVPIFIPTAQPIRTPGRNTEVTPPPTTAPPTPEPTRIETHTGPIPELAQGIATLINQERQELGLNPLSIDQALILGAGEYAKYLSDNHTVFGHDLDGINPMQRAQKYGYTGGWVSEVIEAVGNPDPASPEFTPEYFMKGWKNSPPHAAIISDPQAKYFGVSCYGREEQRGNLLVIIDICVGNFGTNP